MHRISAPYNSRTVGRAFFRALALVLLLCAGLWSNPSYAIYSNKPGAPKPFISKTIGKPTYSLRVLFIGTSDTYMHEMPHQLADIASDDPGNPTQFYVRSVTAAKGGMEALYRGDKATEAITEGPWDYVVLQVNNNWHTQAFKETHEYVARFDKIIRKVGATTLLFIPWPDRPGAHTYKKNARNSFRPFNRHLGSLVNKSNKLASEFEIVPVNVGSFWKNLIATYPEVELYEEDEQRPSLAGSYLTAMVFYQVLSNRDIMRIQKHPELLSADADLKIKTIVAQAAPKQ